MNSIALILEDLIKVQNKEQLESWFKELSSDDKINVRLFFEEMNKTFAYSIDNEDFLTAYIILDSIVRKDLSDMLSDDNTFTIEDLEDENDLNKFRDKIRDSYKDLGIEDNELDKIINLIGTFDFNLFLDNLNIIDDEIQDIYTSETEEKKINKIIDITEFLGGNDDER